MGQSPVQLRMTVPTWIYIAPTQLLIRRLTHSTTLTRIMMQTLNRKGGEPRALRDLQDGRGRGAVAAAGRHPVADRPVAGTACAGMREQGIKCGRRRRQRCAWISPNQRASPFRCYQPRASIALCSHSARFAVARAGQRNDPGPETAGIW